MKKFLSLLLAFSLALSLAACGGSASSAASSTAVSEAASSAAASEEEAASPLSATEPLRIAGLKGPTTMGLVNLLSMEQAGTAAMDYDLQLYGAADEIVPLLIKGEPGTGDVIQAVRHMRKMNQQIRHVVSLREDELFEEAKQLAVPVELVKYVHENGKLPVVNFAAGGVATPADAALMMQLGAEGVFVGSGIFKSGNPAKRAQAIVKAVTNYTNAKLIAELSEDLGEAMVGINADEIELIMEERGR